MKQNAFRGIYIERAWAITVVREFVVHMLTLLRFNRNKSINKTSISNGNLSSFVRAGHPHRQKFRKVRNSKETFNHLSGSLFP